MLEFIDLVVKEGVAPNSGGANILSMLVMMGIISVIFYFLLLRPQKQHQKRHQDMVLSLKRGDEVITSSGVLGTIFLIEKDFFVVSISDNTKIKILKSQIARKYSKESNNG